MKRDPKDQFGQALFDLYVAEMTRLERANVEYFDAAVHVSSQLGALLAMTFASIETDDRRTQMIALFTHHLHLKVSQMRTAAEAISPAMATMQ